MKSTGAETRGDDAESGGPRDKTCNHCSMSHRLSGELSKISKLYRVLLIPHFHPCLLEVTSMYISTKRVFSLFL